MTDRELTAAKQTIEARVSDIEFLTEKGKVVKPGVYLYPQGKQFGNSKDKAKPVPFEPAMAAINLASGGWGLTPNLKDEATVLTVIEKAKDEFKEKENSYEARIKELEAQLNGKKAVKV